MYKKIPAKEALWDRYCTEEGKLYSYRGISTASTGRELRVLRAAINRDYDMGRITRKPRVWIKKEAYQRPDIPTKRDIILAYWPHGVRRPAACHADIS
ncbi:MAG: hypothetical protein H6861_01105 [Rhodospirillales bacterium]|nr:hypothetical protein [Rhodospirillales bacterium]